jgi:hypothetical protein
MISITSSSPSVGRARGKRVRTIKQIVLTHIFSVIPRLPYPAVEGVVDALRASTSGGTPTATRKAGTPVPGAACLSPPGCLNMPPQAWRLPIAGRTERDVVKKAKSK